MAPKHKFYLLFFALILLLAGELLNTAFAAVGCTLADPDRDIKRIFPNSTGYRTDFISILKRGGDPLKKEIETKLKDRLDPFFEAVDLEHAYYTVLKGKEVIGRVHGVNQKGAYGVMQLILATDLEGKILDFYYQKISSPEARKFSDKRFTAQLKGLSLTDFYRQDVPKGIKDPSQKSNPDFKATLRGIKLNLILLDIFWLERKHDKDLSR